MKMKSTTGSGTVLSIALILFFAPWGLLVVAGYWVLVAVQRYRKQVEEKTGENFENKNSLGLPFTIRW
jgi:cytochrome c-type biogenesis protein CcmH/NrfF